MSMNQIPTLIIGIGGIGCQIAAALSSSISEEDRKYVGIIGMDTDIRTINPLKANNRMEFIQTSDERDVEGYLKIHPEYKEWLPTNPFLLKRTMGEGAGQIRALSRLACVAAEENGRFAPILSEINRIRRIGENPNAQSIAITIVGSITGGTGAGLFLQMPFYVRDLLRTQEGINTCVIRGMFIGPDITEPLQTMKVNRDAVCVNAYACLKELNAFYMRPVMNSQVANNLRLEFYKHEDDSVNNIPYNYLYMLEKSGVHGAMGEIKPEEIINYASDVLFTLLFSPVTSNALSVEDNFTMGLIQAGGMNRYSGAGICKLVYPLKTAQEYVALTTVRDIVQKEWMLIDQAFEARSKAARSRLKTDSTVKLPDIKTSYIEIFNEKSSGDNAKLGHFATEVCTINPKTEKKTYKADDFIGNLNAMVKDLVQSDAVRNKEKDCEIDYQKMKNFADAETMVNDVWLAMKQYVKYVKSLVDNKPGGFADSLFPPTWQVMEFQKDSKTCIYKFLATVHPVSARYIIYDIINKLEKNITELKSKLAGRNLEAYQEEDFDPHQEGKQDPGTALRTLRDNYNPIWKLLGPVGKAIKSEEKVLTKLKTKLDEVSKLHVATTRDYLEKSLKLSVSQILLDRFIKLADNYSVFFSTVSGKIEKNSENITRLENLNFPYGHKGVYCSKEAFRKMSEEYLASQQSTLSDETKKAIFEQIYLVQSREFSGTDISETRDQKEMRIRQTRMQLEQVFDTAVVDTIRMDVIKNGGKTVNLTARNALVKEFELTTGFRESDPEYDAKLQDYMHRQSETAMQIAAPMLATAINTESAELKFFALNEECAQWAQNKPSTAATSNFYLPQSYGNTTIIVNNEFKTTEITCLRLAYGYYIEDLLKYRAGTRNALAYEERIRNLSVSKKFGADEMIISVNPHLNINWSEEGFIPAIDKEQMDRDAADVNKAFIYALGFKFFKLVEDDENPDVHGRPRLTWMSYTNGFTEIRPVTKCGKLIGNNYVDLLDAIPFNSMLKKNILKNAADAIDMMRNSAPTDQLLEGILQNSFIADLIQSDDCKTHDKDMNIIDILCIMRGSIPDVRRWEVIFDTLLTVIWEFCERLLGKKAVNINKATRQILTAIYENSSLGKKGEGNLEPTERKVTERYMHLLNQKYEAE